MIHDSTSTRDTTTNSLPWGAFNKLLGPEVEKLVVF